VWHIARIGEERIDKFLVVRLQGNRKLETFKHIWDNIKMDHG
jgi:hypothetical protein